MKYTDDIPNEVLNAMHIIIAAKDGCSIKDSSFFINDDKEELVFVNIEAGRTYKANISGDSVRGSIEDFCRQMILHL